MVPLRKLLYIRGLNREGKRNWRYFTTPKKTISVNGPRLLGFKSDIGLNPRFIVLSYPRCSGKKVLISPVI